MTASNEHTNAHGLDDRKLMLLLDGELDPAEAAELEALVADDPVLSGKLHGLDLVGQTLRQIAEEDERADGIADWVMARLDDAPAPHEALPANGEIPGEAADAGVVRLEREQPSHGSLSNEAQHSSTPRLAPTGAPRPAANDNSRSIYAWAAVAAAVAAGLFVWGRTPASDGTLAHETPATSPPSALVNDNEPAGEPSQPAPPSAEAVAELDSGDEGVVIGTVDFGAQQGSVFYVGGEGAAAATAVVWISDLGGEP